jgi:hypothetical protein
MRNYRNEITIVVICLCMLSAREGVAQNVHVGQAEFNVGISVLHYFGGGQNFPGIRLFGAMSVSGSYEEYGHANYGLSLSVYTNTLGSDFSLLSSDYQIDLIHSFSIGVGTNEIDYLKYIRTVNNSPYFNMVIPVKYAGYLGTNFILNSSGRHQLVGNFTIAIDKFTLNYYNDGAPPISTFGLSDGHDRYWTGGISLYWHTDKNYNLIEFSHDQFTEYSPLVYEFSKLMGIDVMSYPRGGAATVNNASYNLRVNPVAEFGINAGITGSLRSRNVAYGLQDIIHIIKKYPLHPNRAENRFHIGTTLITNP